VSVVDGELLEAWSAGDLVAGRALFDRHFDSLYRFFANKLRSDAVADLVQQTLLGCIEARGRFRGEASFRTFLFQIARYQLYSHLRTQRRNDAIDIAEVAVAARQTSPTGHLARRDERQAIQAAMSELPLDLRLVLELTFWEGLSACEVARVLDVAENTVYTRIFRAKAVLRRALCEDGVGAADDELLDAQVRSAAE
jgi:RNA polymerase sigma-70 factor (ECF subfamily)